ncbi:metal ABC transporter permease [Shimia sp. W99]|uniref:High-affinity zinc uptake system membrane protein ZnuB n=1 Tax=Shimia aestuarii TaxID=254406 RepID=A0A1I4JZW4_9RHOB|nr:metal ABC transporter permease [Shimia aestuarii]SFL71793.1 zinc transport system permease protein [Shimia aestuarii]
MLDDFLVRALLAGIGVALAAAPLGCFVVWRRMAYFGDATAHAAILGVALSLAFGTSVFVGALAVALVMALTVSTLSGRGYAMDTLLGVLAHSALAFGLVAVSFLQGVRLDLMSYLFGDILAVGKGDLAVIWSGVALVIGLMAWRWQGLLTATLNPDLAYASGIDPKREQMVLTLGLALVVAVAIKVVGALLIVALLIIPAASARALARSPESMAFGAAGIGAASAMGGLWASYHYDTPAGPSIVCVAAIIFAFSNLWARIGLTR